MPNDASIIVYLLLRPPASKSCNIFGDAWFVLVITFIDVASSFLTIIALESLRYPPVLVTSIRRFKASVVRYLATKRRLFMLRDSFWLKKELSLSLFFLALLFKLLDYLAIFSRVVTYALSR